MQARNDSTRILRIAAWIWIGYLIAMLLMDILLYLPQAQALLAHNGPQNGPALQPPPPGPRLWPVFLFYVANGLVAFAFLLFTHWKWIQTKLGGLFYPLLVLAISATP